MINKISELAKTNKKISDFHLRGGSDISYRVSKMLSYVKEEMEMRKIALQFHELK